MRNADKAPEQSAREEPDTDLVVRTWESSSEDGRTEMRGRDVGRELFDDVVGRGHHTSRDHRLAPESEDEWTDTTRPSAPPTMDARSWFRRSCDELIERLRVAFGD
jgi:hypothetical protein